MPDGRSYLLTIDRDRDTKAQTWYTLNFDMIPYNDSEMRYVWIVI